MKLFSKAAQFTSHFEGYKEKAYLDTGGVLTIGFGSTKGVTKDMVITKETALEWLERDLISSYNALNRLVKVPLSDNQQIALIDFIYNLGSGAFQRSTIRMKLNRGEFSEIPDQLMRWNKDNGRVLRGLTIRRQAEGELFISKT